MGVPQKKKLPRKQASSIFNNLLQTNKKLAGDLPGPKDPELLRLIVHALIRQIGIRDKSRREKAQQVLFLLTMQEAMLRPVLADMFLTVRNGVAITDVQMVRKFLCDDQRIVNLIIQLAEGRIEGGKNSNVFLKLQHDVVLDYMKQNLSQPENDKDRFKEMELYQKWLNGHWNKLVSILTCVGCSCGYPRGSNPPILSPLKKQDELPEDAKLQRKDPRYKHTRSSVLMTILAHLHGTAPGTMANILKKPSSAAHLPILM